MSDKAILYFLKIGGLDLIKEYLPQFKGKLGVKTHFGEPGNTAYIKADKIKKIVSFTNNPALIETTVLYKSPRRTASGHISVAKEHGFGFAPVDILDGEDGDEVKKIEINKKHFNFCYLGKGIEKYDNLLVISHFKGHGGAGFGGAIKNLGMGLASRRGKLAQHASIKHQVSVNSCIGCGTCVNVCPENAISLENNVANIDNFKCIGCSKCIANCPVGAIKIPWSSTTVDILKERIAEYALATTMGKKVFYINFLTDIVKECDCMGESYEPLTPDIGILLGDDPVAIDQASFDLVVDQYSDFKGYDGTPQLVHGEKIGLGRRKYDLIKIN